MRISCVVIVRIVEMRLFADAKVVGKGEDVRAQPRPSAAEGKLGKFRLGDPKFPCTRKCDYYY